MSGYPPSPVVFNYATWIQRYPEFKATVADDLASLFFNEACIYCDNSPCAPIQDTTLRAMILNMLTAHLAAMNTGTNGDANSLVGRITSASEGTVSVSTDMGVTGSSSGSAAWFQQTKYGAAAFQAMSPFRLGGRYHGGNVPYLGTSRFGRFGGYGYGNGRSW